LDEIIEKSIEIDFPKQLGKLALLQGPNLANNLLGVIIQEYL
jgi:hypothetical protein